MSEVMDDLPVLAPAPSKKAEQEIMAMETGGDITAVIPRNIEEAFRLAQYIVHAGLAPDSYKGDPKKVVIGILKSLEVGLPPITGMSNIMIVNNRAAIWGDAALALVQSKGVVANTETIWSGTEGQPDHKCTYRIWRKGQTKPYEGEFSHEDAARAKLLAKPGPWISYRKRMIFQRARAFALRDGFSDCLSGLGIVEEVMDIPKAPEPVNTAFLSDEAPPSEPAQSQTEAGATEAADTTEPPPSEAPEAQNGQDYAAELDGYIAALAGVETVIKLRELDEEVKAWFANMTAQDPMLRGQWSAAKLSREKELAARKTGK